MANPADFTPLRVLVVEDSEADFVLALRSLSRGGFQPEPMRVESADELQAALRRGSWDIVLCDCGLPRFQMLEALAIVLDHEEDVPFVVLSGTIGEQAAVEALKAGAADVVNKANLPRLVEVSRREIKSAEDRRNRRLLEQRAVQSQRLESLGQLAGGIAHDFNNLLAIIANYSTFVRRGIDRAAQNPGAVDWEALRNDIAAVEDASDRAISLTRQLLAFAKRDVVNPHIVDLNTTVRQTEQLLQRTLGDHIELETSEDPDLWPILAVEAQLEQVLVNLAVNARDAMPQGGRLRIETANVHVDGSYPTSRLAVEPGRYVQLRVTDTGHGMDSFVMARAFEPFFTTKPTGEGTGLGLATIYGIVTQSGGDAVLTSEPRVGTTFTAIFPASAGAVDDVAPAPRPTYQERHGVVLVVDDEERIRELTRRLLVASGYEVIVANDPMHAIEIASDANTRIDLLLTDVVMPHLSGKELAQHVAAIRPTLPVIYMSGHTQSGPNATGWLVEGDVLVEKPFSEATLLDAVAQAMA